MLQLHTGFAISPPAISTLVLFLCYYRGSSHRASFSPSKISRCASASVAGSWPPRRQNAVFAECFQCIHFLSRNAPGSCKARPSNSFVVSNMYDDATREHLRAPSSRAHARSFMAAASAPCASEATPFCLICGLLEPLRPAPVHDPP